MQKISPCPPVRRALDTYMRAMSDGIGGKADILWQRERTVYKVVNKKKDHLGGIARMSMSKHPSSD
jgi:hypothetical protein